MNRAEIIRAQTEILTDYEMDLYEEERDAIGLVTEDELRSDTNPYFEG